LQFSTQDPDLIPHSIEESSQRGVKKVDTGYKRRDEGFIRLGKSQRRYMLSPERIKYRRSKSVINKS
jgi:hypothetical protein